MVPSRQNLQIGWLCLLALALSAGAMAAAPTTANSATGGSVVSVSVPSTTNLSTTACPSETAAVTSFGTVGVSSTTMTSSDCSIVFGSSNDTAMLRVFQQDLSGSALWHYSIGATDTTLNDGMGAGMASKPRDANAFNDYVSDVVVMPDGDYLISGRSGIVSDANGDCVVTRWTMQGALDTSWSSDGWLDFQVSGSTNCTATSMVVQADGKVLVAGEFTAATTDAFVARLNDDGTFDTTFGGGDGISVYGGTGGQKFNDVILRPDGRIVACGQYPYGGGDTDPVAVGFTANGTYEEDAYGGGSTGTNHAEACGLMPDGRVVAVGRDPDLPGAEIVMFEADLDNGSGGLDLTWDATGRKKVDLSQGTGTNSGAEDVAVDAGGKITIAGWSVDSSGDMALARLTSTGTLDPTFGGGDGIVRSGISMNDRGYELLVQRDGYLAVVGQRGSTARSAIWRTDPQGEPDLLIAGQAWQTINFPDGAVTPEGGTLGADGRIVVAGDGNNGANGREFTLASFAGHTVNNYDDVGAKDWQTAGAGVHAFGACLRAITGAGATPVWTVNATCPATDGTYWSPIPATAGTGGSKIATSASTVTNTTASFRFGFRTSSTQVPGSYFAPIAFEVAAPNV